MAQGYEVADRDPSSTTPMTATFKLDCPHCGTAHVGFELASESQLRSSGGWHVCARCNYCGGLVVLDIESDGPEDWSPGAFYNDRPGMFKIEEMYPSSGADVPAHLPDEVAKLFKQGAENVPANPDAAGAMFRKTLEAALRDKCPDAKGRLIERIDQAVASGVLTADLGGYAHTVRVESNEAAHGTYDEADARSLHSLVTLVLLYAYTLPGEQAQIDAKARAAAEKDRGAPGQT